jgi:hypothetical protein
MKKNYGRVRGSRGIVINRINEPTTRLAMKLMDFKLLRKRHTEEGPTRVIVTETQCVKGTVLNWSLYLLNLFLDDCQDAQDLGTKLHYLWLLIIIALVGWRHPKYTVFFQRIENCCTTHYETLWHTSITKERKTNSSIFVTYFEEIHEKVVETWRIPPEVVEEHKDIPNFQVSRNNVWI